MATATEAYTKPRPPRTKDAMTQATMETGRKSGGDVCTVVHSTVYPTRDVTVAEDKPGQES